ncbi:MAG: response regulator [Mariprofundaceae bacterium]|nr:response regulator [Mariprofundaceae bacterium]
MSLKLPGKNWFGNVNDEAIIIRTQTQQVTVRIVLALLGASYLAAHAPHLMPHLRFVAISLILYIAFNLCCLPWIRKKPSHTLRLLLAPIFDVYLSAMAMWLDGGIVSPYYIIFLIIIVGNGVRFGNIMLLYSQMLSLLALAGIGMVTVYSLQQPIDWLYLLAQVMGVILVPGYAYMLGKKLEKARHTRYRAEQETVGLLDASPIPACTFETGNNGNLYIRYANPAMSRLFDKDDEDIEGEQIEHLAIAEDSSIIRDGCQQVLQHASRNTAHRFNIRYRAHDGQLHSLMCQANAIRWRGRLLGLCLITDVTENERLHEQLERAHRQDYMNSLLAGLTHDFRNVLTNIIGNAEVMQMDVKDKVLSDKLGLIIQAGERGSEMITHLMHMARKKKTARKVIQLQDTLHATINLARLKLPENISLECTIDDDIPPILGHSAQIDQVMLNLVENAAQAITGSGKIKITVEQDMQHSLAEAHIPAIRITLQDNGRGIKKEDMQHVFDSFWTTREDDGGSGLGLTMVKRIVGWHHGEINIESTPGKGTSVCIVLPPASHAGKQGEKTTADIDPATTPATQSAIRPWRVLLVDDEPDVLRVHQLILEHIGLSVICANDGNTALQMLDHQAKEIDLVMTDYNMPQMDGLEMTRRIRQAWPQLPVLMITAFSEDERLRDTPATGFSILEKPVSSERIAAHIATIQQASKQ